MPACVVHLQAYIIQRLVHGMESDRLCARPGFATALVLVLRYLASEGSVPAKPGRVGDPPLSAVGVARLLNTFVPMSSSLNGQVGLKLSGKVYSRHIAGNQPEQGLVMMV